MIAVFYHNRRYHLSAYNPESYPPLLSCMSMLGDYVSVVFLDMRDPTDQAPFSWLSFGRSLVIAFVLLGEGAKPVPRIADGAWLVS